MKEIRNKIISDLNHHNCYFIPNRTTAQKQLESKALRINVVLYNKQNMAKRFKSDIAELIYGLSRIDADHYHNNTDKKTSVSPVAIAYSIICSILAEYHKSYAVYSGYLLNNGKLVLTNNETDSEYNYNDIDIEVPKDFNNLIFVNNDDISDKLLKCLLSKEIGEDDASSDEVISEGFVKDNFNMVNTGPHLSKIDNFIANNSFNNLISHFLIRDITKQGNLYKFKNELAWLSTYKGLDYIYIGKLPYNKSNEKITKQIINQVIYLLIISVPLFKLIDHASVLSDKKVTINLNSGLVDTKKHEDNLQPVNNNKFINQLIHASNPHILYCGNQPVKSIVKTINIDMGIEKDNTNALPNTDSLGDRGFNTRKESYNMTNLGNNSMLYDLDMDSDDISNYKSPNGSYGVYASPWLRVILSNHPNAYKDIKHYYSPFVYNEFKLNANFYMTLIQSVIGKDDEINTLDVIVPNIIAYMYPNGVILNNYRLDVDHVIKYGRGPILNNMKYDLISMSKGTFNHYEPTQLRVYAINTENIENSPVTRIRQLQKNPIFVNDIKKLI